MFEIRFDSFKRGSGCRYCMSNSMKNDVEEVKKILDKKGFTLVSDYTLSHDKITVRCKKEGHIFETTFDRISNSGCGCPCCREYKGEVKIREILEKNNIKLKGQYRFKDCKDKSTLPFDFYIPDLNIAIEYDGVQHFEPIDFSGQGMDKAIEELKDRKRKDDIKTQYCKDNNIKLIRIPYWEFDNIENILIIELQLKNKHE